MLLLYSCSNKLTSTKNDKQIKLINVSDTSKNYKVIIFSRQDYYLKCSGNKTTIKNARLTISNRDSIEYIFSDWYFTPRDSLSRNKGMLGSTTPEFYIKLYENDELVETFSIHFNAGEFEGVYDTKYGAFEPINKSKCFYFNKFP